MLSKLFAGGVALGVLYLVGILFLLVGWVLNIVDLFHSGEAPVLVVFRFIGIVVFPLGGILGYF